MKTAHDDSTISWKSQPSPAIEVEISDTQRHLKIDHNAVIQLVRKTLLGESQTLATISVAIVDDSTIRSINQTHLNHDWPTDVISFLLSDEDDAELQGELVVSAEMASVTATEAGVEPWHELALYLVHGLLHLCGHDDTDEPARSRMRIREGEVLNLLGLPNAFRAIEPSLSESERYAP